MAPRKLAIIGYGKIAQDQHIPAITASGAFELAAVVSGHAKSVPGVDRVYQSPDQLFARAEDIGVVAVCSAPGQRYETARQALLAGKHVLLEKPPAATVGEARVLERLARAGRLTVFATWHARANAAVREAARRLEGEAVQSMAITWREDVRKWHPGQAWVWEANGFGVFDPGINALSIATAILPCELVLSTARLSVPSNRQQPIAADLTFVSEPPADQLTANFDWRQTGPQTWDIEVRTRAGTTLLLSDGGASLTVDGQRVQTAPEREYPDLYARFAELIETGASDMDLRPFELVADAFLCAERASVNPFEE
jgi:D-galactose 1-dehydrogenase